MIYEIYRIPLYIAVFVQRLAVCDAAVYDVSVDKAFDLRIVVAGSHVIQSVCACFYTVSSIVQEAEVFCLYDRSRILCLFSICIINSGKFSIGSVSEAIE